MGDALTLSIIIPAYNAAATLGDTIASALDQPGVDAEIVVIDDGSTDGTLAVAQDFEPRVRVLSGPNRGVSHARNRGISETQSDWILFLDSDDLLCAGTLQQRLDLARSTDADVIVTDWEDLIDDGRGATTSGPKRSLDWPALAGDAQAAIASHVWATTAALMYRRTLVERIGGFRADLPVIQDARFLFDAAFHGARFAHSPHIGARYRVVPGSLSRRNPSRFWLDVLTNGRQIEALWVGRDELSNSRRAVIAGIYDHAARALLAVEHPAYFSATADLKRLGLPRSRHSRFSGALAQVVGLKATRQALQMLRRG